MSLTFSERNVAKPNLASDAKLIRGAFDFDSSGNVTLLTLVYSIGVETEEVTLNLDQVGAVLTANPSLFQALNPALYGVIAEHEGITDGVIN